MRRTLKKVKGKCVIEEKRGFVDKVEKGVLWSRLLVLLLQPFAKHTYEMHLVRDHLVEKIREERGKIPALYHKTGIIV